MRINRLVQRSHDALGELRAGGVNLIAVTPCTNRGALDLAGTDRLVDFCLDRGASGLPVLGIMGEATKLTAEESTPFAAHRVGPPSRWAQEGIDGRIRISY